MREKGCERGDAGAALARLCTGVMLTTRACACSPPSFARTLPWFTRQGETRHTLKHAQQQTLTSIVAAALALEPDNVEVRHVSP